MAVFQLFYVFFFFLDTPSVLSWHLLLFAPLLRMFPYGEFFLLFSRVLHLPRFTWSHLPPFFAACGPGRLVTVVMGFPATPFPFPGPPLFLYSRSGLPCLLVFFFARMRIRPLHSRSGLWPDLPPSGLLEPSASDCHFSLAPNPSRPFFGLRTPLFPPCPTVTPGTTLYVFLLFLLLLCCFFLLGFSLLFFFPPGLCGGKVLVS